MRLLVVVLLLCVSFSLASKIQRKREVKINDLHADAIRQIQKERKERRILRKKKQRLKELRKEIRLLSTQIYHPEGSSLPISVGRIKSGKQSRDQRWRKKLLEKMKVILRRLDRIEKRKRGTKGVSKPSRHVLMTSSMSSPVPTTTLVPTSTAIVRTSISTPNDDRHKLKRIQSSIQHSRNGQNGTLCAAHKNCQPGRCCQRVSLASSIRAQCTFFSLPENAPCIDSCQCGLQLHCFQPIDNSTIPFCKRASSNDVMTGTYLHNKDAVLAAKRTKKKKK